MKKVLTILFALGILNVRAGIFDAINNARASLNSSMSKLGEKAGKLGDSINAAGRKAEHHRLNAANTISSGASSAASGVSSGLASAKSSLQQQITKINNKVIDIQNEQQAKKMAQELIDFINKIEKDGIAKASKVDLKGQHNPKTVLLDLFCGRTVSQDDEFMLVDYIVEAAHKWPELHKAMLGMLVDSKLMDRKKLDSILDQVEAGLKGITVEELKHK